MGEQQGTHPAFLGAVVPVEPARAGAEARRVREVPRNARAAAGLGSAGVARVRTARAEALQGDRHRVVGVHARGVYALARLQAVAAYTLSAVGLRAATRTYAAAGCAHEGRNVRVISHRTGV